MYSSFAWEPSEELRLDESFNPIRKSLHFTVLVTIYDGFYSFGGPRRRFWAWEPSEELRLAESFNLINKSRYFVILVTIYDNFNVLKAPDAISGPGNHLRSCALTRASSSSKHASFRYTGDEL